MQYSNNIIDSSTHSIIISPKLKFILLRIFFSFLTTNNILFENIKLFQIVIAQTKIKKKEKNQPNPTPRKLLPLRFFDETATTLFIGISSSFVNVAIESWP